MAKPLTDFDKAILNTAVGRNNRCGDAARNDILYRPWAKTYAKTLDEFYTDFVAPRLPDPDIVLQWHEVIKYYAEQPEAIIPVRAGNTKQHLRRGWLVNVNDSFSYMFTDNDLAVYIYKMALDGFCPEKKDFLNYMTEFKDPADIGWFACKKATILHAVDPDHGVARKFLQMPARFNRAGGSGIDATEIQKNAYINTGPAPACCLGKFNYKHAHIIDVSKKNYLLPGKKTPIIWEDVKPSLLGTVNDYCWDASICNYVWKRSMPVTDAQELKELLTAHLFRFLDPLNHFLAPMREQSRYIDADGNRSMDIGEYEELQKYIIEQKCVMFPKDYTDFLRCTCAPEAWRTMSWTLDLSKNLDLVYHERSLTHTVYGTTLNIYAKAKSTGKTSGGSKTSTSGRTGGSDVLSDFRAFSGSSGSSYCSSVRTVMHEMGLSTLAELDARIDDAINFCTNKMAALTGKSRKNYSDHRCALRKYKLFLATKTATP